MKYTTNEEKNAFLSEDMCEFQIIFFTTWVNSLALLGKSYTIFEKAQ